MKILSLACTRFSYLPTTPLLDAAAAIAGRPERVTVHDALVLLCTVEQGDSPSQVRRAADRVHRLAESAGLKAVVVDAFAHLSAKLATPASVVDRLAILAEHLAPLEIHTAPFGWQKELSFDVTAERWSHHLITT